MFVPTFSSILSWASATPAGDSSRGDIGSTCGSRGEGCAAEAGAAGEAAAGAAAGAAAEAAHGAAAWVLPGVGASQKTQSASVTPRSPQPLHSSEAASAAGPRGIGAARESDEQRSDVQCSTCDMAGAA